MPDCGDGCIGVYGTFMIDFVWERLLFFGGVIAVLSTIFGTAWTQYYQPCQSFGDINDQSLTFPLKCVHSSAGGCHHKSGTKARFGGVMTLP